jgi:hypothetical protein
LDQLLELGRKFPMQGDDQRHFENILILRAYVLGWTGDPLEQPAASVLAAYRQMLSEKGVQHAS